MAVCVGKTSVYGSLSVVVERVYVMRRAGSGDHFLMTMCVSVKWSICRTSSPVGAAHHWVAVSGNMTGVGMSEGR